MRLRRVTDTPRGFRLLARGAARVALVLAGVLFWPGAAAAELLAWEGTLRVDFFVTDPALQHWELFGSHAAVAEGPLPAPGVLRVAGGISATDAFLVTDPDTVGNAVAAVQVEATLGIGTLSPFPPPPFGQLLASRELPVFGGVRLCLLTIDCHDTLSLLSFYQGPANALGVGGILTGSLPTGTRISIEAAPWTLGTASVPVETAGGGTATAFAFGFVHGPASATGTTAGTGGEIQLVTPLLALPGHVARAPGFSRLRLRFAPEPEGLALLGAGALFLLFLARRRTRP